MQESFLLSEELKSDKPNDEVIVYENTVVSSADVHAEDIDVELVEWNL